MQKWLSVRDDFVELLTSRKECDRLDKLIRETVNSKECLKALIVNYPSNAENEISEDLRLSGDQEVLYKLRVNAAVIITKKAKTQGFTSEEKGIFQYSLGYVTYNWRDIIDGYLCKLKKLMKWL